MRQADDHKGLRVDLVDDGLDGRHLGAGDDAVQHGTGRARITARPFEDGHAAHQFLDDAFRDGLGLVGDDHRRADRPAAFERGLGHDAADVERDHRVQRLLPAEDESRREDHCRVHDQVTLRHRHAAPVIKDARQDVRAAAGAACAIHQPEADPADDGAVQGVEEDVTLQVGNQLGGGAVRGEERQLEDQVRQQGVGHDGKGRPQGEAPPAEESPTEQKERDVADENHQADRPARVMVDQLRDAAHPARGQLRRDEEQPQRKGLDDGTDADQNIITQGGPVFFHHFNPFVGAQRNAQGLCPCSARRAPTV